MFDVIVIGGGIIGCAVAHELGRAGARALLLERGELASGASQASAGVLAPYIEGRERGPILDLAVRSLELYDLFVEQIRADSGQKVAFHRSGTLQVARGPAALRELEGERRWLETIGVAAAALDAAALRNEEPSLTCAAIGGLLVERHAYVRVRQLVAAVAAAARARGVTIKTGEPARRILVQHSRATGAETASTRYQAGTVVVAAGAWSRSLKGLPDHLPLQPIRGQLAVLKCNHPPFRRVLWDDRCYLVPWEDGTVLAGATAEDVGFDERVTAAGLGGLLAAAQTLVPALAGATVADAWVGLRPDTADHLPVLGPGTVEGLLYATGHFRNGILLAPITARVIRELVVGGRSSVNLQAFAAGRFAGVDRSPAWESEHAEALAALQLAERESQQAIAGSVYAGADAAEAAELQKEARQRLEEARLRLEEVRSRKPG